MRSTTHRFGYVLTGPGDTPIPTSPKIWICLERWHTSLTDSKTPLMSADLMTEREIDEAIDELKRDLDAVRGTAKSALKKAVDKL